MRIASKIRQQERYEKGLREIRQHEERKRVKSEIGRVASATRAKYVVSHIDLWWYLIVRTSRENVHHISQVSITVSITLVLLPPYRITKILTHSHTTPQVRIRETSTDTSGGFVAPCSSKRETSITRNSIALFRGKHSVFESEFGKDVESSCHGIWWWWR